MDFNIKKFLRKDRYSRHVSANGIMAWLFIALGIVGVLLVVLDIYIFYTYSYSVVNQESTSDYTIDIKKGVIEDVAGVFKDRQKKFEEARTQNEVFPNPFQ